MSIRSKEIGVPSSATNQLLWDILKKLDQLVKVTAALNTTTTTTTTP